MYRFQELARGWLDQAFQNRDTDWLAWGRSVCFLAAIAALNREWGPLPLLFERAGAALALMGLLVLCLPSLESGRQKGLAVLFWLLGLWVERTLGGLTGPCLFLLALGRLKVREEVKVQLHVMLLTALSYQVFLLWERQTVWGWKALLQLSFLASQWISGVTKIGILAGPSPLGLRLVILFLLYLLSRSLVAGRPPWRRVGWVALAMLLMLLPYAVLAHRLSGWGKPPEAVVLQAGWGPHPWLLFLLLLLPLAGLHARQEARASAPPLCSRARASVSLLLLSFSFLALALPEPQAPAGRKILLWDTSGPDNRIVDWERPVSGKYGLNSGGMYGIMPEYLKLMGFQVDIAGGKLTPQRLQGYQTLVMINPGQSFSSLERAAIVRFVERGGSFLALGEHTREAKKRQAFNDLLGPFGIRLNFDCSWTLYARWVNDLELRPHPALAYADDQGTCEISVGATLALSGPAEPLIRGKYGWADVGDVFNREEGFIGDYRRNPREQLGDIVLAAVARYGRGKVLAFGDPSSFQNASWPRSYPFLYGIFCWLNAAQVETPWAHNPVLAFFLAAGALLMLRRHRPGPVFLALAVWLGQFFQLVAQEAGRPEADPLEHLAAGQKVALVDTSHSNLVSNLGESDYALWSLEYTFMRQGFLPLRVDRLTPGRLKAARTLVIIAPLAPVSKKEVEAIERFVRVGGLLWLCVGWEERQGSAPLLRTFGLSLEPIPLGEAEAKWIGGRMVRFRKAWPLRCPAAGAQVLLQKGEYPLAVSLPHGRGRVVAFGDSGFLTARNLEHKAGYRENNLRFLERLLADPKQSGQEALGEAQR